ncbi:MAG: carboxylate--amine ligase, partial [Pseudomonadota bacterium]
MNIIFISPHFPSNYYQFSQALANQGVKVLGIADCSYDHLDWELKKTLTEYYRVDNMEDYGQLKNAVNFFHHKYGPIDRIFSLNEHWLEKEANLRSDFNIPGIKKDTIDQIKQKSQMKQLYQSGGIAVARGEVIRAWKDAEKLVKAVGFPLVAKPDKGVGAANTFKINNVHELKHFFDNPPQVDYIFEEYISGELLSFDGLVGQNGELLFYT